MCVGRFSAVSNLIQRSMLRAPLPSHHHLTHLHLDVCALACLSLAELPSVPGTSKRRYIFMECFRGQISNRYSCVRRGIKLARALNRTLVMPVLHDHREVLDMARYLDMRCMR